MKRIIKKAIPLLLAVLIVFQTVYSSVQTAQASAIPEVLYYTYWDLINTIYATCGYDSKVDESVINNHGVTGKQAWNNFVTFVENSAKANYKFVGDGMSKAFSELENLVNTATEKGISMTQDLYDMLKSVFADQVQSIPDSGNFFDDSSFENYAVVIAGICGTSVDLVPEYGFFGSAENAYTGATGQSKSYLLNIIAYDRYYYIFEDNFYFDSEFDTTGGFKIMGADWARGSQYSICFDTVAKYYIESVKINPYPNCGYTWIMRNGVVVGNDVVSAQVSEGACPKEVPDVAPWRKNPAIPDEWRVINPNETPEQNPDDKPEVLPVVIPIHPTKPDTKPDTETTENPDTETTEKPDKDNNPDKKKNPVVNPIINPDTGNVIDPNTGWDIDPSTGKLINPNTGELVDPDISNSSSLTNKFGDITKLFPFCIPFDLVRLIRGMSAEKKPPVFHFEHKFKGINYTFVVDVDLSDYDKYIKLFRFGMQIFFVLVLMFLTSKISNYFA